MVQVNPSAPRNRNWITNEERMPHLIGNERGQYITTKDPIPVISSIETPTVSIQPDGAISTAGDAIGPMFQVPYLPEAGIIDSLLLIEPQDVVWVDMELWLFKNTLQPAIAGGGAFTPTDEDIKSLIGVILIDTEFDAINAKIASQRSVGLTFRRQENDPRFYGQLVTRGTPTYVAALQLTFGIIVSS